MKNDSVLALLRRTYALILPKERWCREYEAIDTNGRPIRAGRKNAVAWCVEGAFYRLSIGKPRLREEALDVLDAEVEYSLTILNDGPDGHRRVLAALRRAIEKREKQ